MKRRLNWSPALRVKLRLLINSIRGAFEGAGGRRPPPPSPRKEKKERKKEKEKKEKKKKKKKKERKKERKKGTMSRTAWSRFNRLLSGRTRLAADMHRYGIATSPVCDCGAPLQTPEHIIASCPRRFLEGGLPRLVALRYRLTRL